MVGFKTLIGAGALIFLASFATSAEAAKPGCEADPGKPIPDGIADNVLRQMPPRAEDTEDKSRYLPYLNPTLRGEYPVVIEVPANHPSGTFWYHAHIHGSTAMQVSSGMAGALIVPGGLDNVPEIKAAEKNEKIMLFQQIAYNEDGEITDYSTLGSQWWNDHNRRTTINGQIAPVIEMRPGEIQRWRMIHGGINEAIKISIVEAKALATRDANAASPAPEQILLNEIAVDGLATGRCDTWKSVTLYPGYRSDVLIKAPSAPGEYVVLDAESDQLESLYEQAEPREVLARIKVAGPANDMRLPCAPGELADCKAIKDITQAEYEANKGETQTIEMSFVGQFGAVNGIPYDTNNTPRKLKLGTIGKWELNSGVHPFHIHVNPFQTTRKGPDGKDQIVWRDTYRTGIKVADGVPPVEIMSRYEVFTGNFVLHCHILDHEDKGMMEEVAIIK